MIEGYEWFAVIGIGLEVVAFGIIFFYQKLPSTTIWNIHESKKPDPRFWKLKFTVPEAVGFLFAWFGLMLQIMAVIYD